MKLRVDWRYCPPRGRPRVVPRMRRQQREQCIRKQIERRAIRSGYLSALRSPCSSPPRWERSRPAARAGSGIGYPGSACNAMKAIVSCSPSTPAATISRFQDSEDRLGLVDLAPSNECDPSVSPSAINILYVLDDGGDCQGAATAFRFCGRRTAAPAIISGLPLSTVRGPGSISFNLTVTL